MRHVILRDDDTNALTPPECLETLYRPFLDRGLPVNLATIPAVSTSAKRPDGQPEGFLRFGSGQQQSGTNEGFQPRNRPAGSLSPGETAGVTIPPTNDSRIEPPNRPPRLPLPKGEGRGEGEGSVLKYRGVESKVRFMGRGNTASTDQGSLEPKASFGVAHETAVSQDSFVPLTSNQQLIDYLRSNSGYHLVQHGYHHDPFEFDRDDRSEILKRIEAGRQEIERAGFERPETFVAPHDKFSRTSYSLIAHEFRVISTGWFELRRLPYSWWPKYAVVKARKHPHWNVNGTTLLSHPGCLLSYQKPYASMLDTIKSHIRQQPLTVLVTHWWEYFRDGKPDAPFIAVLHALADYLHSEPDLRVIRFSDV